MRPSSLVWHGIPTETAGHLLTRVLAVIPFDCQEGIEEPREYHPGDEPARRVRRAWPDARGRREKWVCRVPLACTAGGVAWPFSAHRDPRQVMAQLVGERIHRAAEIWLPLSWSPRIDRGGNNQVSFHAPHVVLHLGQRRRLPRGTGPRVYAATR